MFSSISSAIRSQIALRSAVQQALELPLKPLAVIGIGKPKESVFLVPADSADSLTYYRKEGVHYVPKLKVDDLVI